MKSASRKQFLENAMSLPMAGRLVTSTELPYRVGQSLAWVYKAESLGKFPKRVRTGARSVAWRGDEVQAWIDDREQV